MKKKIYLDNNASTQVAPEVVEVIHEHLLNSVGNPSSVHAFGRDAKRDLTRSRDSIAEFLGVKPEEITFTSSGTEAVNLTILGILKQTGPGHVISSNLEHAAVMKSLEQLENEGSEVTYLSAGLHGAILAKDVRDEIQPNTKLITLMAANNETGVKTDITAIAEIALEYGIPFVVDGVALLGKETFQIPEGVTAIGFSGQKIHAPKGTGFAFIRNRTKIHPLIVGGEQEGGRRAGTENLPGIVGLAKAIEVIRDGIGDYEERVRKLRDYMESRLVGNLGGVFVNGEGSRVCNTTNLSFERVDGESLLTMLDMEGVAVSHGAACSSGGLEPSRVLLNMGIDRDRVNSAIRISLSRYTTQEEVDMAVSIIEDVVKRLR